MQVFCFAPCGYSLEQGAGQSLTDSASDGLSSIPNVNVGRHYVTVMTSYIRCERTYLGNTSARIGGTTLGRFFEPGRTRAVPPRTTGYPLKEWASTRTRVKGSHGFHLETTQQARGNPEHLVWKCNAKRMAGAVTHLVQTSLQTQPSLTLRWVRCIGHGATIAGIHNMEDDHQSTTFCSSIRTSLP